MSARITPLGDNAITISFGDMIDEEINGRVFSAFDYLQKQDLDFIQDIIPAYASLSVVYDVMEIRKIGRPNAYDYMHELMETVLHEAPLRPLGENRLIHVPVCYDESFGTDLINMSLQTQLPVDEIIQLHSSATYRVYMLGFLPGFAYMGRVDEKIAISRKAVPAKNVFAGSVGIADAQTGIYPVDSPGGWNIIGQTPVKIFDVHKDEPCMFQPGDRVKFEPITQEQFYEMKK